MQAYWSVWSDATSEVSARRVAMRLLRQLGRPANQLAFFPYPKTGGCMFTFQTDLEGGTWNDYVVDAVELGQRVAHAWSLSGDVRRGPEGWSTQSRIAGVTAIQWLLLPHGREKGTNASDVDL
jgi:hypothetical protein